MNKNQIRLTLVIATLLTLALLPLVWPREKRVSPHETLDANIMAGKPGHHRLPGRSPYTKNPRDWREVMKIWGAVPGAHIRPESGAWVPMNPPCSSPKSR